MVCPSIDDGNVATKLEDNPTSVIAIKCFLLKMCYRGHALRDHHFHGSILDILHDYIMSISICKRNKDTIDQSMQYR